MEYLIGTLLGIVTCSFAFLSGFDKRVFYPVLLIVIATYYVLFAVMGNSLPALTIDSLVAGLFLVIALLGFKKNLGSLSQLSRDMAFLTFLIIYFLTIRECLHGGPVSAWFSTFSPLRSWRCS
jgi:hypothetical protein